MLRPGYSVPRVVLLGSVLSIMGSTRTASAEDGDPAKDAYDRSIALYAAGDKQSALAAMEESFRISNQPELLYNLARVKRELGRCEGALADYREFLRRVPESQYRDPALAAVRELDSKCGVHPAKETTYWTAPRIVGWSSIAAGVAAGAGAAYFAGQSHSAHEDEQQLLDAHANAPGEPWSPAASRRQAELADDAEHSQNMARIFAIIAGGLVTGGVLVLTLVPNSKETPPGVALQFDGNRAYLDYRGRF